MINFKHIIDSYGVEKADSTITIGPHPVWDYKRGALNTVYLISQDPWIEAGEDIVTLKELQKYVRFLKIPYEDVVFATEADKEELTKCKIEDTRVVFNH